MSDLKGRERPALEQIKDWLNHPKFHKNLPTFSPDHHKMMGWDVGELFYRHAVEAMGELIDEDFIRSTFLANGGFVEDGENFVRWTLVHFAVLRARDLGGAPAR